MTCPQVIGVKRGVMRATVHMPRYDWMEHDEWQLEVRRIDPSAVVIHQLKKNGWKGATLSELESCPQKPTENRTFPFKSPPVTSHHLSFKPSPFLPHHRHCQPCRLCRDSLPFATAFLNPPIFPASSAHSTSPIHPRASLLI